MVNLDVPYHPDDYVHRIGRTGRAGKEGRAFTLADTDDAKYLAAIEKLLGQKLNRQPIEGISGELIRPRLPARRKAAESGEAPAEIDAAQADEATPAPRRRRRKSETAAEAAPAETATAPAAEAGDEKPRRRRATRGKTAEAETAAPDDPATAEAGEAAPVAATRPSAIEPPAAKPAAAAPRERGGDRKGPSGTASVMTSRWSGSAITCGLLLRPVRSRSAPDRSKEEPPGVQTIFVMVKCELGPPIGGRRRVQSIEEVSEVYSVSGQYDLIMKFHLDTSVDIGRFVNNAVQALPG